MGNLIGSAVLHLQVHGSLGADVHAMRLDDGSVVVCAQNSDGSMKVTAFPTREQAASIRDALASWLEGEAKDLSSRAGGSRLQVDAIGILSRLVGWDSSSQATNNEFDAIMQDARMLVSRLGGGGEGESGRPGGIL